MASSALPHARGRHQRPKERGATASRRPASGEGRSTVVKLTLQAQRCGGSFARATIGAKLVYCDQTSLSVSLRRGPRDLLPKPLQRSRAAPRPTNGRCKHQPSGQHPKPATVQRANRRRSRLHSEFARAQETALAPPSRAIDERRGGSRGRFSEGSASWPISGYI